MDRNTEQQPRGITGLAAAILLLIGAGLYVSSRYNYLLFHSIIELFSVVVAFAIFILSWHTRDMGNNSYLLFIGIASFFTGSVDLLHALAYKGMGIFPGYTANLPTQLWIVFRYMFSLSFFLAPFFIKRTFSPTKAIVGYLVLTLTLLSLIFSDRFPACFIEGQGLTAFKIYSEYIIAMIFIASLALLFWKRQYFDRGVLLLMAASALASLASEISFTQYVSVYGPANMIGHLFMFASIVLIYRAVVITGLVNPSRILFRDLAQSEEALRESAWELEAANRELEAFIYSVSHDLRAPLRATSGFARFLAEDYADRLDDRGRDYLARISLGSAKMSRLIEDLLNLSRISRLEIDRTKLDLSAAAYFVVSELRSADPGRSVDVNIREGVSAFADPGLIEVVLSNILGNAWKFTSRTDKARIEFGTVEKDGKTVYYVRDNGAGFDPLYREKIFSPFERLHSDKEFDGTGIGLTIVERVVRRHGGKVWAEGEVGKGAAVYFTLE